MNYMNLKKRIELLGFLGEFLLENDDKALNSTILQTFHENKWFTEANQRASLRAIATQFLDKNRLENFVKNYKIIDHDYPQKTVGIVMAGNIPLVGFQDWLCVFLCGQKAAVKLSEKDQRLFPFLVKKMAEFDFEIWNYIEFQERLTDFEAVIATGSNNTSRYFEQYFSKKPNIIRKNRTSIAILDGSETAADFEQLGHDIFDYFGLGCRNVSKIYVNKNNDFQLFLETTHEHWKELANHDKWRNNFDYSTTLFIFSKTIYYNNGAMVFLENPSLHARISTVHYEFYEYEADLIEKITPHLPEIQCLVSQKPIGNFKMIPFGQSQKPTLADFPDGVDVMDFILSV
jgi:hypothetical protein